MASSPFIVIGEKTESPFLVPNCLWQMYSKKGIRTVFVSLGSSKSSIPDLTISEILGCPVHIAPITETEAKNWSKLKDVLKSRSLEGQTFDRDFAVGADEKWVLPKNIRIQDSLPWWGRGTLDISGCGSVATVGASDWVRSICREMQLPSEEVRIDILKLDLPSGVERGVLASILDAGFRPSLVLVHWGTRPDCDIATTLVAGHLQMCGYYLGAKIGSSFLYFFTDQDLYMQVSWEDVDTPNPLVKDIVSGVQKTLAKLEGVGRNDRSILHTDPPPGEAAVAPQIAQTNDGSSSV